MRKAFSVAVLVLAFGCPVIAGEIHNPAPQPTPSAAQEPPATQEPTADGEIPNGVADTLTQIVLAVLVGILP